MNRAAKKADMHGEKGSLWTGITTMAVFGALGWVTWWTVLTAAVMVVWHSVQFARYLDKAYDE